MGEPDRDFPPYRRVQAFVRRWQLTGLLTELHDRLRDKVREKEGRTPVATAAIVDSQSVRAAGPSGHRRDAFMPRRPASP
ncbi:hypothetical protein [Streptomyces xantholiticus]|uniref:hypothetical protein n=1 Tax=Streptomyces xantholiticus TaxID=68285 RepID=UPI0016777A7B|nr:hypothetical protein [Streptomyces xantholiticus]GGW73858.1 hypothetical protein GCM10010381_68240 [Streptomyces xantholiticus]